MKRRIVLLGPPASGKGTQAEMITAQYQIPSVSPGLMLRGERQAGTALGLEADRLTSCGKLVPDSTINGLVQRWLEGGRAEFVMDGYPRSLGQAAALEKLLDERDAPLGVVLSLESDLATLQRRVRNRLVCGSCGRSFSLGLTVGTAGDPCPACGGDLVRRSDDGEETLARRMEEYVEKTQPVGNFYAKRGLLRTIDATRSPAEVFSEIEGILKG